MADPASGGATSSSESVSPDGVLHDAAQPDIAKLIEEKVSSALSGYSRKVNSDLEWLRKRVGSARPESGEPQAQHPVTIEDLKASRQLGAIEAALPESARAALADACEGLPLTAQARIADAMARSIRDMTSARARGTTPDSPEDTTSSAQAGAIPNGSRGMTPAATSNVSRAAGSAAGAAAEYPRTRAEWLEVRKSDPRRAEMLYRDPAFSPPVR